MNYTCCRQGNATATNYSRLQELGSRVAADTKGHQEIGCLQNQLIQWFHGRHRKSHEANTACSRTCIETNKGESKTKSRKQLPGIGSRPQPNHETRDRRILLRVMEKCRRWIDGKMAGWRMNQKQWHESLLVVTLTKIDNSEVTILPPQRQDDDRSGQ